jgi:hypothetical protein
LVHDSSKEATELAKKGPKFPWGPNSKVRGLYGTRWRC